MKNIEIHETIKKLSLSKEIKEKNLKFETSLFIYDD